MERTASKDSQWSGGNNSDRSSVPNQKVSISKSSTSGASTGGREEPSRKLLKKLKTPEDAFMSPRGEQERDAAL